MTWTPPEEPKGSELAAALHDPYSALRLREFRRFLIGYIVAVLGMQMQGLAVGWEVYQRTGSSLALGLVGLVQVVPVLVLALPAGHTADRFSRVHIMLICLTMMALTSLGLAVISAFRLPVVAMYVCLFVNGVAKAFQQPARASLVPLIVPRERFPNAVTWNTGAFHLASVAGPLFGGVLIWWFSGVMPLGSMDSLPVSPGPSERIFSFGPSVIYLFDAAAALVFWTMLLGVRRERQIKVQEGMTLRAVGAGLGFVWQTKIILAALTLDMFAVLLGGATSLLPVFAEILHVGPLGLGAMQAAPGLGAVAMALLLAHRPAFENAGRALLWAVGGFGIAIIVFGLSRSYALTVAVLFVTGALDNVSVVIRHTLVQLLTPDEMRGRVSAVNSMFIGASNDLGGFESGLVAALFSPTISVVSGGIGTLVVVAAVMLVWPQLRKYGRLDGKPRRG